MLEDEVAAEKHIARLATPQTSAQLAQPAPVTTETESLLADILTIDAEVGAAIQEIRARNATPEQHVRNMDAFLALNREVLVERETIEFELATRQTGTKAPPQQAHASINSDIRVSQIIEEISELMKSARTINPQAYIAALDAKRKALQSFETKRGANPRKP